MNESATMHDSLSPLNAELAQALGEVIWAFSMVERLTYRYLKILSQEGLDELLADQALKVRIRVIRQLLGRVQGRDKIVADVERCLTGPRSLRLRGICLLTILGRFGSISSNPHLGPQYARSRTRVSL